MPSDVCTFCRTLIDKQSPSHPELCVVCYMLIKKAESEEKFSYLCDS